MLLAWREQAANLEAGEITKEEYDQWRYRFPELDETQGYVQVPSKELSDFLISTLKNNSGDKND